MASAMSTVDDLNYDCNYNIFLIKNLLGNIQVSERPKVVTWIRRLMKCNQSISEMQLRNDFMYYLVLNVQNGELRPPFTEGPPCGPLNPLLLPGGTDTPAYQLNESHDLSSPQKESGMKEKAPMAFSHSPDGGAFLAAQPIPRCGAFCYLAVVSKGEDE